MLIHLEKVTLHPNLRTFRTYLRILNLTVTKYKSIFIQISLCLLSAISVVYLAQGDSSLSDINTFLPLDRLVSQGTEQDLNSNGIDLFAGVKKLVSIAINKFGG